MEMTRTCWRARGVEGCGRGAARAVLAALLAMLLACAEPADEDAPTTLPSGARPVASGGFLELAFALSHPALDLALVDNGLHDRTLFALLDLRQLEPQLIHAAGEGVTVARAMEEDGLFLALGSGFVTQLDTLQPLGLLQAGGEVLSAVEPHGYTRILGIGDNGLQVVHKDTYDPGLFQSALQLGPGIIESGELDISERDLKRPKYYRSVLALCGNTVAAGISLVPINLRTLGQSALEHLASRGLTCEEMVNFAGDRQAVLALRDGDRLLYHGDIDAEKVSLIGFREPAAP